MRRVRMIKVLSMAVAVGLASSVATATVSKDLAYPAGALTSADDIINQNYFVNHFYSFDNMGIGKVGNDITALILRPKGASPLTLTLERMLNNKPTADGVNAQDLAIFRSGKLKGTGMLITDFVEAGKSQTYEIFIPSIRKVRRFAEPARDDAWGGSDFTFGDVTLRKPGHETHTLTATDKLSGCLGVMEDVKRNKYTQNADIKAACYPDGKDVYIVASTPTDSAWWYDKRVSYIDTTTFVDYRTEYFKGGDKVKVIDRDWVSAGLADARANYWGYWYGTTLATGHETMAFIPANVTKVNHTYAKKDLWSTSTLRKMPKNIK